MNRQNEQGIALVITLFLMAALSALAVSIMFLAQTETSASRNYKTMSQARYGGEAGVHRAMNYLMSSAYTTTQATAYTNPSFNVTTSPVKYNGQDVVLRANALLSNYPVAAVKTAYAAAAQGQLSATLGGVPTVIDYSATATLLSMQPVNVYGGGIEYIQTWQITASGTVPGPMPATVEVTAMLERDTAAAETYAIFATGRGCGAINLRGNVETDSYDSRSMSGTPPATTPAGGAVGTNGNLSISGSVDVKGNLDTPRTGVGSCNAGTPTALTGSGNAQVRGNVLQLPQEKKYPSPTLPDPLPPVTDLDVSSCAAIATAILPATCAVGATSNDLIITTLGATPLSLGNITIGSSVNLTVQSSIAGGTVNMHLNSIAMGGSSQLSIGNNSVVVMNVVGNGESTPIDFTGGTISNGSYDPSKMQILYAGTGEVKIVGGAGVSATIYAPNADIVKHGSGGFYGSVLGETFTDQAGQISSVHYDTSLATKFFTLGNFVMSSFSWKKY